MEKNNNPINRRKFIKIVGISTAALSGVLPGCTSEKKRNSGKQFRSSGERGNDVSHGCMWR